MHGPQVMGGYESPDEDQFKRSASKGCRPCRPAGCILPATDPEKAVARLVPFSSPTSLTGMVTKAKDMRTTGKIGLRDRICCYQWTWFTMTMATGGVANVLFSVPYETRWLTVIGTMFCLLNLVLFVTNCILISLRFHFCPGSFVNSFKNQVESLFIPSFFVSIAIILLNICEYGVPRCGAWLLEAMEIMFWIYIGASMIASAGLYLILWSTQVFPLHTMTPIWVFPAYPLLLTAPIAGHLINAGVTTGRVDTLNAVAVALAGVTVQGTGFLISFMICAAFLYRLMTQKLPRDSQRPGVFISIGPSAFTVAGIVHLGNQCPKFLPENFMGTNHSIFILKLISVMIGLSLWGLSIWFFLVSVGSLVKYCKPTNNMPFQMTWFSFVFPNTALVTATEQLGIAFDCSPLKTVGTVFAGCIVVVWLFVFSFMIRSLWNRQLLWPKDDD